jgi:hypothetical protein
VIKEIGRLVLVYGVPAAIVALWIPLAEMLFPHPSGTTLSDSGSIFFAVGFIGAIAVGWFFHFWTRRWFR